MIVRWIAALLALVSVALFARRLGPDRYGWFAVATAVAGIVFWPLLQAIAATIERNARRADADDPTITVARILAGSAALACAGAFWLPSDADPALAVGVVVLAAGLAALLLGVTALRARGTADRLKPARAYATAIALTALGNAAAHWVDRFFLVDNVSRAELGVYAAAVDLSQQSFLPLTWLLYVKWLPRLASAQTAANAPEYARIEMRYALAVMPALTGFILLRAETIAAVFGDAYAAQAGLLPWIAIAAVLGALRLGVLDTRLCRENRTRALLRNAAITAFASVASNALYVPRYGVIAAVAAALFSQSLAFMLAWRSSRDLIAWRIPRVQFERIVFCCAAMAFVVLLLPTDSSFAARVVVAVLVYAGALLLANGLGVRDSLRARMRG